MRFAKPANQFLPSIVLNGGGMENLQPYFDGQQLYGDDFDQARIAEWYRDEEEGYANLGAKYSAAYGYAYHAWNRFHAFRHLQDISYKHVLGFGSAYGDELLPILARAARVTIVDPSSAFVRESVHGVAVTYVKPAPEGTLPLPDNDFDFVSCLGVLHHIPNVSFVVGELARVAKPGGYLVIREPIVSMGDWRKPRRGLTRRERGIPLKMFEAIAAAAGLMLVRRTLCGFPLTPRLFRIVRSDPYNSGFATWVDWALSNAFAWNVNYHPRNTLQRLRPTSAFFVLKKL